MIQHVFCQAPGGDSPDCTQWGDALAGPCSRRTSLWDRGMGATVLSCEALFPDTQARFEMDGEAVLRPESQFFFGAHSF